MHSVSDLTTFSRPTSGDVPPKLVGASTTVVGSKVYLYGGRLVTERRMVTDMWLFDLNTLVWRRLEQSAEEDLPASRYFHSADAWDNYLVIFGGMGINPEAEDTSDELLVLSDVRFFDLRSNRWMSSAWSTNQLQESQIAPKPRYAHLSSISGSRLFVIGGQDLNNVWLDDVYVYDLYRRGWVSAHDYPRHCGTYRSVAVAGSLRVRVPLHEQQRNATPTAKPVFSSDGRPSSSSTPQTSSDALIHLPYSAAPTEEFPTDIYLYSNYNFTDVKRELEVFSPRPGSGFDITDHSSSMVGTSFPPGLRFPSGAILGHHLIIAGTYLAHSFQSSSVWALNLHDMTWSRIDPGSTLSTGSWFRTALWADANKFVIFGNRAGNLVDDYNRRLLSWDDVALIDLEAFGIYQPPKLELELRMQEIGLAALEEGVLADFEVICDDDRRIRCSRKLLDERWPWFREQRKIFLAAAQRALEAIPMSAQDGPAPELPGGPRPDPRLSPRSLALSEPYPVTLALLQYFYSMALLTPLQHAPPVLSALLVIATNYNITHLQALVKHAMHRALSNSTSVGVYEVATLCSCRSLQIRALKTVMLYNQKRPAGRSRQQDRDNGGPARPPEPSNGDRGNGGSAPGPESSSARPRGMSDAQWMNRGTTAGTPGGRAVAAAITYEFPPVPGLPEALTGYQLQGSPMQPPEQPVPKTSQSPPPSALTKQPLFLHRKRNMSGAPRTDLPFMPPPPVDRPPAPSRSNSSNSLSMRSTEMMRRNSVVSMATHDDLTDLGDMLAPIVEVPRALPEEHVWHPAVEAQSPLEVPPSRASFPVTASGRSSTYSSPSEYSDGPDERSPVMPSLNIEMPPQRLMAPPMTFSASSSSTTSSPRTPDESHLSPTLASSSATISSSSSVYFRGRHHERDSDTPSLTSSASRSSLGDSHRSSSLMSPPVSPGPDRQFSIYDAADGLNYLATISEPDEDALGADAHFIRRPNSRSPRPSEPMHPYSARGQGFPDNKWRESDAALTFAVQDPSSSTIRAKHNVDALRLNSTSPTNTIIAPPEVESPMSQHRPLRHMPSVSSSSGSGSASASGSGSSKGINPLARVMSPSHTTLISAAEATKASYKAALKADAKAAKEHAKALKAEVARQKKEEDRLRKERLMLEFRAKADADKRKRDAASTYSGKSDEKKKGKAAWEEQGAMYSGINTFL